MFLCFISIPSHPIPSHWIVSRVRRELRFCKVYPWVDNFHPVFSPSIIKDNRPKGCSRTLMLLPLFSLSEDVWSLTTFLNLLSASSHFSSSLAKLKPVMSLPGADSKPRDPSLACSQLPASFWPPQVCWGPRSCASGFRGRGCWLLNAGFPKFIIGTWSES